jgi:hypothetical protein
MQVIQSFDLLDLTIALTPASENAPADAIASMIVCCEALGLKSVAGLLTNLLTLQEHTDLR